MCSQKKKQPTRAKGANYGNSLPPPQKGLNDQVKNYKWKVGQLLSKNLNFQGLLPTTGAKNTTQDKPFKTENNAQTFPKQLLNNFEKSKTRIFHP